MPDDPQSNGPTSGGLKDVLNLDEPQTRPSTEERDAFKRSFQEPLDEINRSLQYTAANADPAKQNDQTMKRDKLIAIYQAVVAKYDAAEVSARAAGEKAIAAIRNTAQDVVTFKDDVEKSVDQWKRKLPTYDDAVAKIDQMEQWGAEQVDKLRQVAAKIQEQADQNLYQPASDAMDKFVGRLDKLYEKAKQEFERQRESQRTEKVADADASGSAGLEYDEATGKATIGAEGKAHATGYSLQRKGGPVEGELKVGHVEGQAGAGYHHDPATGATLAGGRVAGKAVGAELKTESPLGKVEGAVGKVEGEGTVGYYYDPETGERLAGARYSGKAVVAEVNGDTPLGKIEAAVGKIEGESVVGYEYDPEKQVHFAGVKAKAAIVGAEGKVEGKYGKLEAKALSASVETKTGVEYDKKTGKVFIGTANKAEAVVAEATGELKAADDSVKLTGEVQVLKAEATLDANMVVDKYGADFGFKAAAEAVTAKATVGGEIRLTPKAFFDNSIIGAVTGLTAPDYLDFGPVVGAKGAVAATGSVGGGVEAGGRLGVDEVNLRVGGDLSAALLGAGVDVKAGMRLGPLKYAVDHKDEIAKSIEEGYDDAKRSLNEAEKWVDQKQEEAERRVEEQRAAAQEWLRQKQTEASEFANEKSAEAEQFGREKVGQAREAAEQLGRTTERGIDAVFDTASRAAEAAKEWVGDTPSEMVDKAKSTKDWLADKAADAWNNLWGD